MKPSLGLIFALSLAVLTVIFQTIAFVVLQPWNFFILARDLHYAILQGTATDPYRYRILTHLLMECLLRITGADFVAVSLSVRLWQNLCLWGLLFFYLRQFGISPARAAMGTGLFTLAVLQDPFNSGTAFYNYTELILFISAGLLIMHNRFSWIIPLTLIATLNRETGLFLPLLLLGLRPGQWRRAVLALALGLGIYAALRLLIGPAAYSVSAYGAIYPGLPLLWANVGRLDTWIALLRVFNFSLLALLFRRPQFDRLYLFLVLPWLALVFVFGTAIETRLYLLPLAVVFLPAFLYSLPPLKLSTMRAVAMLAPRKSAYQQPE